MIVVSYRTRKADRVDHLRKSVGTFPDDKGKLSDSRESTPALHYAPAKQRSWNSERELLSAPCVARVVNDFPELSYSWTTHDFRNPLRSSSTDLVVGGLGVPDYYYYHCHCRRW